MFPLQVSLFWRGSKSGTELVGPLMSQVHGLVSLRPNEWPAHDYHGLHFEDPFWFRARQYLQKIRPWLREQGASDFLVMINGFGIEEYLERQIKAEVKLRKQVEDAVQELKGSRFSIPSPRIKRARQLLETAIS